MKNKDTKPAPHPFASLIKKWADDTSQKVWSWRASGWELVEFPDWTEEFYAIGDRPIERPTQVCQLGGVTFPRPESAPLRVGMAFWVADRRIVDAAFQRTWEGDAQDKEWQANGMVHLTQEGAIAHTKALIAITRAAIGQSELALWRGL